MKAGRSIEGLTIGLGMWDYFVEHLLGAEPPEN
jgi:hypothetical protein